MEFLDKIKKPYKILAPMVGYSDLSYRLLSRKYGADICYSEMINTETFLRSKKISNFISTSNEDFPFVIQICGNNPIRMLEAANILQNHCQAIDINFGCPQFIAKRGFYGAYLENEWSLIEEIVKTLSKNLKVPVFCKIRIFNDLSKTLKYAKLFEDSGCKLLVVHGRTKEQKKQFTGLADWFTIKEIKKNLKIPVISNGNIFENSDIEKCIEFTNCDGVMVAESHLYNPLIFTDIKINVFDIFKEYTELCIKYETKKSYFKDHFYKLFYTILNDLPHFRQKMVSINSIEEAQNIVNEIKEEANVLGCNIMPVVKTLGGKLDPINKI